MTRVFRFSSSFSLVCQTGYKYLRHKKQSESCTFPHDFQVIVTKPTSQHLTTIQHTTTSKQMIKKSINTTIQHTTSKQKNRKTYKDIYRNAKDKQATETIKYSELPHNHTTTSRPPSQRRRRRPNDTARRPGSATTKP